MQYGNIQIELAEAKKLIYLLSKKDDLTTQEKLELQQLIKLAKTVNN